MSSFTRRRFLAAGAGTVGTLAFGPAFWRSALAAGGVSAGPGPYGELGPPDANGLRLPPGFTAREVARANQPVAGTAYRWPVFPDGSATFAMADGGWVLVANSESLPPDAGTSAIRFRADGSIAGAYRILAGTAANCSGGPTPWGTWLSCEEHDGGHVWECDPAGAGQGAIKPAMGTFNHEAACVDPAERCLYMTEDEPDGGFYRFTPASYPDLSSGLLEVALVDAQGAVTWEEVPDPTAIGGPTRGQVPGMKTFDGGEGLWFDSGRVYFTTKGDNRVWEYDTTAARLTVLYDAAALGPGAPLTGVDNLTVTRAGEIYVCEDGGNMELCLIAADRTVAPFLRLEGEAAEGLPDRGNELAGVAFSPRGDRMYFSAQRAFGFGVTYEVRGPFAGAQPGPIARGPVAAPPERPRAPRFAAAGRIRLPSLRRRGLAVRVELDAPARVVLALRTADLARVPGKRGSAPRPRTVTLARAEQRLEGGAHSVRLRVGPRTATRLRARRSVNARLTLLVRDDAGRVEVLTREVRVKVR